MSEALRKLKARCAARRRNLRDPKWQDTRMFPKLEGMTVKEYVARYKAINCSRALGEPFTFVNINGEKIA